MSHAQPSPEWHLGTWALHGGDDPGLHPYHAHIPVIFPTSTYAFPDVATGAAIFSGEQPGYVYGRVGHPNAAHLARKIALLEAYDFLRQGADPNEVAAGLVFASGMAAITAALLARARRGSVILAQKVVYGTTFVFLHKLAPQLGIQVAFVEGNDAAAWERAFREHVKVAWAYIESPANPTLDITDIQLVTDLAHQHGAWVIIDNTFATPYCQRPLSLGVDVVVHSTTKYISGHGQAIGGAVVSRDVAFIQGPVKDMLKIFGGMMGPFAAWMTMMGLKTFELRMQRHCDSAARIARFLEQHPKVARVFYPGLENFPGHAVARRQMHCFGGMISFELKGGYEAGVRLMEAVSLPALAVSLGKVDSLIEHPASMTHAKVPAEERQRMGITDGLVRFSVGIEPVEDLLADLERALAQV